MQTQGRISREVQGKLANSVYLSNRYASFCGVELLRIEPRRA
jgi:hypothetical protein